MSETPEIQPSKTACHMAARDSLQSLMLSYSTIDVITSMLWHIGDFSGALIRSNPERYKVADFITMIEDMKTDVVEGAANGTPGARAIPFAGSSTKPN